MIRQELQRLPGVDVSLRTVERAVEGLRRRVEAEARVTVRFETSPGKQMQIDYGQCGVGIGEERVRVHLFVATLGYSRRSFVMAFLHERQSSWLTGIEVLFNERFHAFCRYWGVIPKACAPYRARTKGKCENGVGYVKRNVIAGREFGSFSDLQAHLQCWMREVADVRRHGTTGERPIDRFHAEESKALRALQGRPPFQQIRELCRKVHTDACVEVDTNRTSVPWRLMAE